MVVLNKKLGHYQYLEARRQYNDRQADAQMEWCQKALTKHQTYTRALRELAGSLRLDLYRSIKLSPCNAGLLIFADSRQLLEDTDTVTNNALAIWTVGHSTRTIEGFIDLLRQYQIEILVDVRHFPGSRKYPHFGKVALRDALVTAGSRYEHLVELGGRRPVHPDSHNVAWRNASFRSYADYMETEPFHAGVDRLLEIARASRTAIMCSEAVWWRCHRSMITDYLKAMGVQVFHILSTKKAQEHPYTSAAHLVDGRLSYEALGGVEPGSAPISKLVASNLDRR